MDRSQTSSQNNLACIKAFLKERLLQEAIPEIEKKIQHLILRNKCLEEEIKLKNDEAINIENYVHGINEKVSVMTVVREENKKLKEKIKELEARLKFEEGRRCETAHEMNVMKGSLQLKDEEIRIAKERQNLKEEEISILKGNLNFKDEEIRKLTLEKEKEREKQKCAVQAQKSLSIKIEDEAEITTQTTDEGTDDDTDEDIDMAEWDSLQDDFLLDEEIASTNNDATVFQEEPMSVNSQQSSKESLSHLINRPVEVMLNVEYEDIDEDQARNGEKQQDQHMKEDTYEKLASDPQSAYEIVDKSDNVNGLLLKNINAILKNKLDSDNDTQNTDEDTDELLKNIDDEMENDPISSDHYSVQDYNLDENVDAPPTECLIEHYTPKPEGQLNTKAPLIISKTNTKSKRTAHKSIAVESANFQSFDDLNQKLEELVQTLDARQFKCKICGKIFKQNSHAREHVEFHIDGLSFPCRYCAKIFRTRNSLRCHKRKCVYGEIRKMHER